MSNNISQIIKKILTTEGSGGIIHKLSMRKKAACAQVDIKHTVGNTFVCIIFRVVS